MTAGNLLAYFAQIAIVVLVCAPLPRVLGLRSPGLHYLFWRVLLAVCILLPAVEPWQRHEIRAVPSGLAITSLTDAGAMVRSAPGAGASFTVSATAIAAALLLSGIVARLAWLSVGVMRLRQLRARATRAADAFADLQATIGTSAAISWSDEIRQPVTFGVRRPVVLLPGGLAAGDSTTQRAVVAHELHHVRRRDWAWIVWEEIARSIFWFHPAVWWLISRVQLARETVVDELSIRTTNARRAYLDALVAFAEDGDLVSTPAFSARRHLFHRVMLLSKEGRMSSIRIASAACVLLVALAAGSWSAAYAFPLHRDTVAVTQHAQSPRLVTLALTNAELPSVLRIFGEFTGLNVVFDPKLRGQVTFLAVDMPWDQALDQILAPHGLAFEVKGSTLSISARSRAPATRPTPGPLTPPKELPRSPDQYVPPPPPPPPAIAAAQDIPESFRNTMERLHPVRIGTDMTPPMKIKDVRPRYPDEAREARIEGEITLEGIIDPEGRVADARVVEGVAALNDAALDAVKQWQFKPTLLNGEPTSLVFTCTITFHVR